MTDDNLPWYAPGRRPDSIPRQRRVQRAGRVQSCELFDDSEAGAGFDVVVFDNGELLYSRRSVDERGARYVAASLAQDLRRTGWADIVDNQLPA